MEVEPVRETHATLVDLLDRILDRGVVIHADVIVSVAGIPLIGVNLRAALAGMETMLKYGVMVDWDERSRAWERQERKRKAPALAEREKIVLRMIGSYLQTEGRNTVWRSGQLRLTDKRLLLHQGDFDNILFQVPLSEIRSTVIKRERHFTRKPVQVLHLFARDNRVLKLRSADTNRLKEAIGEAMRLKGFPLKEN
jgi:hypothetical protein